MEMLLQQRDGKGSRYLAKSKGVRVPAPAQDSSSLPVCIIEGDGSSYWVPTTHMEHLIGFLASIRPSLSHCGYLGVNQQVETVSV